jgi:hydroxymethylglutaryl-CoA synthase
VASITGYGSYLPYSRLQRSALGAGKGERTVASYDEDSVSMAVEAGRDAVRGARDIDTLLFATTSPPYAEKLNAATIAAALDLPATVRALELGSSTRMGLGALLSGADVAAGGGRALVLAADVVIGAPGGSRESGGGDGAVAFVTGPDAEGIAKFIGRASATTEILDVWRLPSDPFAKQWEERFGAETLGPIAVDVATRALKNAGCGPADLKAVVLDGTNARAVAVVAEALRLKPEQIADPLASSVGRAGTAAAGITLANALDRANAGDKILVLCCADGADAVVLEATERLASHRPQHSVDRWLGSKRNDLPYNTYLKWRGILPFEPPRRPEPERPAAPPMKRADHWKYAFFGSRCEACNTGHLPPQRVCVKCGAVDQMREERFADTSCKVATYTLDYLAYTLQPPVVAAIVDYAGGGRLSCELTDVDPKAVKIGNELEMTFRRLYTGQGVHNYFWKARPKR